MTLCTDSWLMSGTSLSHEYWLAHTELGFSREEIDRMILNAFGSSFLPCCTNRTEPKTPTLITSTWLRLFERGYRRLKRARGHNCTKSCEWHRQLVVT